MVESAVYGVIVIPTPEDLVKEKTSKEEDLINTGNTPE
jgi:hypothetical protein